MATPVPENSLTVFVRHAAGLELLSFTQLSYYLLQDGSPKTFVGHAESKKGCQHSFKDREE